MNSPRYKLRNIGETCKWGHPRIGNQKLVKSRQRPDYRVCGECFREAQQTYYTSGKWAAAHARRQAS